MIYVNDDAAKRGKLILLCNGVQVRNWLVADDLTGTVCYCIFSFDSQGKIDGNYLRVIRGNVVAFNDRYARILDEAYFEHENKSVKRKKSKRF